MAETERGYEQSDLSVRVALIALAIVSAAIVVVGIALWLMKEGMEREPPPAAERADTPGLEAQAPAPRLQVDPPADLAALRARERRVLEATGWVDREAGIARIPVSRAMEVLVHEGWPEGAP